MAYATASTIASIKPMVEVATPRMAFKYNADPENTTDVARFIKSDETPIAQIVPGIDRRKKCQKPDLSAIYLEYLTSYARGSILSLLRYIAKQTGEERY